MNYDKRAMSKQGVCWYKIDEFAYAKGIPHFNCVHVLTRGGSGGQKIGYKVQNRTKSITSVKKKTGFKIQNYNCCQMLPAQNDKKSRKS